MLVFVFALLWIERAARRQRSFVMPTRRPRAADRVRLRGIRGWIAFAVCLIPIIVGFIVPALTLVNFALHHLDQAVSASFVKAASHSLVLATTAAARVRRMDPPSGPRRGRRSVPPPRTAQQACPACGRI